MKREIWKIVTGHTDYEVSYYGNVRSCKNPSNPRLLKQHPVGKGGYYKIALSTNGELTQKLVHRLVAEMFIPNPEEKPCVNHIDGNKLNNVVDNLEWVTQYENLNKHFSNNHNPDNCYWCVSYKKHIRVMEMFQQ